MTGILKGLIIVPFVFCAIAVAGVFLQWSQVAVSILIIVAATCWIYLYRSLASKWQNSQQDSARLEKADQIYRAGVVDISNRLKKQIASMDDFYSQIQKLLEDAVHNLQNSFTGLNQQSQSQAQLVNGVMNEVAADSGPDDEKRDKISYKAFADETNNVLQYLVDQIVNISKESVEMAYTIDDAMQEMSEIGSLLDDLTNISEQTNLLALNAAIEAARAGEAGRGFAVVADEVRNLSQSSNSFSEKIRDVVSRTKGNIGKAQAAAGEMASKDLNLAIESKNRVNGMLHRVMSMNEFITTQMTHINDSSSIINASVGDAVRSLQFEDLITQLLVQLHSRSQSLKNALQIFDETLLSWDQNQANATDQLAAEFKKLKQVIESDFENSTSFSKETVMQSNMSEGEIELF